MPRKAKSAWLKGCDVCNVGLIRVMDEMIEKNGISVNKAAKMLAEEGERKVGMRLYSPQVLVQRYRYHKGLNEKALENLTPPPPQTQPQQGSTETEGTESVPDIVDSSTCHPHYTGDIDNGQHETGWKKEPEKPPSNEMSLDFIKGMTRASASAKERKESELEKAAKHIEKVADLLEMIIDGELRDDGTEYDKLASASIKTHGPRIVYCYYQLGISQEATIKFFENGEDNGEKLIIERGT